MTSQHSSTSADSESKSNKQIGEENLQQLQQWLDAAPRIPERNGKANISAIAVAAGLERQVLYRPEARVMVAEAVAKKGLGMPDQQPTLGEELPQWAKQKMHEMEMRLAVLDAELSDLRGRLQRYEYLERHMTATGVLPR